MGNPKRKQIAKQRPKMSHNKQFAGHNKRVLFLLSNQKEPLGPASSLSNRKPLLFPNPFPACVNVLVCTHPIPPQLLTALDLYAGSSKREMHVFEVGSMPASPSLAGRTCTDGRGTSPASVAGRLGELVQK